MYFATCERNRALSFLRKLCPSANLQDTPESAGDLLNIIEADEIRVCDPEFHGGQVIQGRNWKDDTHKRATDALQKAGVVFGAA